MRNDDGSTSRGRRRFIRILMVLIGVVALGLRLYIPGPTTETYDENLWIHRSEAFAHALAHGNLAQASAGDPSLHLVNPTMPGVTTMWAGVIGTQIARVSGALGFSEPIRGPSAVSPQALRAAQGVVSAICAALIFLLMVLLNKLFDARVALLSGALLAVEPWLVGLGQVLHTDAMVMLFSICALCAFAWAIAPHPDVEQRHGTAPIVLRSWLIASALLAMAALLTKTNAIGILGPGFAVLSWPAWRTRYRGHLRGIVAPILWSVGIAVVAALVLWPALGAAPFEQIRLLFDATKQVGTTRDRYFHGHLRGFIPQFYVVALVFRLSPLMIAWCIMGFGTATISWIRQLVHRPQPKTKPLIPAWLVLTPIPYFIVLALSSFGYDRYATALIPFGVIAGACVVSHVSRLPWIQSRVSPMCLGGLGVIGLFGLSILPIRHAPFNLEYVNSVSGGMQRAIRWIPIESGQTSSHLDDTLRHLTNGHCDLRIANAYPHPAVEHCGTPFLPKTIAELRSADYAFTFRVGDQPSAREWFQPWLAAHATLLKTVSMDGVTMGQLWKLPASADRAH